MPEVTAREAELLATGELTPKQRAMTNARYEVMSHKDAFIANGVTLETVQKVAEDEAKRIQIEFEEKENADPIRKVVEVLHTVAATPEEKLYANTMEHALETQRTELAKVFKEEESKAQKAGRDPDYPNALKQAVAMNDARVLSNVNGVPKATFSLLDNWIPNPSETEAIKKRLVLPVKYEVKVLQALTTLRNDEGIDGIKNYPPQNINLNQGDKPYYSELGQHGGNLPTNIDGVTLTVYTSEYPSVNLKVNNISDIQKIAEFPTSI